MKILVFSARALFDRFQMKKCAAAITIPVTHAAMQQNSTTSMTSRATLVRSVAWPSTPASKTNLQVRRKSDNHLPQIGTARVSALVSTPLWN